MYAVVTTKSFDKAISKLPANWQKRIVAKIREVAADPNAPNENLAASRYWFWMWGREGGFTDAH